MWLFDQVYSFLAWLGIFRKQARLVFLGLDNAGKSTLLHRLSTGRLAQPSPTAQPQSDEFRVGNTTCHTFDLGGHLQARRLWADYTAVADGVVFVVDAADAERLEEAGDEFRALLAVPGLADVPFAVLGNKIDDIRAVSEAEMRGALGLPARVLDRPVELFMCSVVAQAGYAEAFEWLMARV
jgi:GTP-binding protein SAR1